MRHWKVQLTIEAIAYLDVPDSWDDSDGIVGMARDAVTIETYDTDVVMEVENIRVDDIVEVE